MGGEEASAPGGGSPAAEAGDDARGRESGEGSGGRGGGISDDRGREENREDVPDTVSGDDEDVVVLGEGEERGAVPFVVLAKKRTVAIWRSTARGIARGAQGCSVGCRSHQ